MMNFHLLWRGWHMIYASHSKCWIFTCFGEAPEAPDSSPPSQSMAPSADNWISKEIETNLVVFFTDLVVAVYRSYLQSIWNSGRLWNLKKTFLEKSFFTKIWLPCWNSALIHLEGTKTFWKYWKCLYLIFVTCWGFVTLHSWSRPAQHLAVVSRPQRTKVSREDKCHFKRSTNALNWPSASLGRSWSTSS